MTISKQLLKKIVEILILLHDEIIINCIQFNAINIFPENTVECKIASFRSYHRRSCWKVREAPWLIDITIAQPCDNFKRTISFIHII